MGSRTDYRRLAAPQQIALTLEDAGMAAVFRSGISYRELTVFEPKSDVNEMATHLGPGEHRLGAEEHRRWCSGD